ncbi:MAG: hypothetical protein ACTSQ8_17505 [Candidatus Helarchaeota archaeon]
MKEKIKSNKCCVTCKNFVKDKRRDHGYCFRYLGTSVQYFFICDEYSPDERAINLEKVLLDLANEHDGVEMDDEIDSLARLLHEFYLEAVKHIEEQHYNKNAKKDYDELTPEQKFIDMYIAKKLLEFWGVK